MNKYEQWMADSPWQTRQDAYLACAHATRLMVLEFPELCRVRGHYRCSLWGERLHWWCKTPDGEILDPTKIQFPSHGAGDYLPWDESSPEPTGKCANCGVYVYGGDMFCDDACSGEYASCCAAAVG